MTSSVMEFFLDYANSSVFTRTVLPYEMATTNASTANTTVAVEPMARNESLAVIEIAVQVTILLLAVVGNSIVVLFLFLRPKKLSRMHLLILHLSLADLFVAFCQVLPQIAWDITYRFKGGDFLCRLVKYFQGLAMFASSYVLITTAIDRYFAICHPLTSSSWGSGKIHKMVGAAWSLALLFSVPQMVIFSYMEVEPGTEIYDCWGVFDPMWKLQLYITWITVSVYIIPTILLAILYGNICYSVWKCGKTAAKLAPGYCKPPPVPKPASSHAGRNGERGLLRGMSEENVAASQGKHHHGISRAKIKTIKLTMTVIACYLICWSPFFVAQMWAAYDPNAPFYGPTYTIILLLASLNSCTNPWIYMAFSESILDNVKDLFRLRMRKHGTRDTGSEGNFMTGRGRIAQSNHSGKFKSAETFCTECV